MGPRILVVNVNWVGDALFSTPALRALKRSRPDARVSCLVPPRCRPVLERNPYVDEVLVAEEGRGPAGFLAAFALAARLRGRFDTAIFFHRSSTRAFAVYLAGIPERIGIATPKRSGFLTRAVEAPPPGLHRIDGFLRLVEQIGVRPDGRRPDFFPEPGAGAAVDALLANHGLQARDGFAAVHAGGNWGPKRWPARHFAEWIRLFRKETGLPVVLCGTEGEKSVAGEILALAPEAVSMCGETSLSTLAELFRRAKVLVSNDSGPIHLASTQGTPTVGLFGPTSPDLTAPVSDAPVRFLFKDVGCEVPCYFRDCDLRVCMDWITPEEALTAAKEVMA